MFCLSPDDAIESGEGVALSEIVDSGVGVGTVISSEVLNSVLCASVETDVGLAAAKNVRAQDKHRELGRGRGGYSTTMSYR